MKVLAIASVLFFAVSAHDVAINATEITQRISTGFAQDFKGFLDAHGMSIVKANVGFMPESLQRQISTLDSHFVKYLSPIIEENISDSVLETVDSLKEIPAGTPQEEVTQLLTQHGKAAAGHVIPQLKKKIPTWSKRFANLVNSDPAAHKLARATKQEEEDENLETTPSDRRSNVNLYRRGPLDAIVAVVQVTTFLLMIGPILIEMIFVKLFVAIFWAIMGWDYNEINYLPQ